MKYLGETYSGERISGGNHQTGQIRGVTETGWFLSKAIGQYEFPFVVKFNKKAGNLAFLINGEYNKTQKTKCVSENRIPGSFDTSRYPYC
jgi:hypothetical protein